MTLNTKRPILLAAAPATIRGHTVNVLSKLPSKGQGAETEPPTEFLLWAFGDIETTKGTFTLTKEGAAEIVRKVEERGLELAFDYEHATFNQTENGPVPAAGWHSIELRDDGLWLVNIEWTKKAEEMIRNRELRYYSPAFEVSPTNEITDYHNTGLTNFPATHNLKPLVASRNNAQVTLDMRATEGLSGLSFDDIRRELDTLLRKSLPKDSYWWIVEVYDSHLIFAGEGDGKLYEIGYAVAGNDVSLTGQASEVKRAYTKVEGGNTMDTLLLTMGLPKGATEAQAVALARDVFGQQSQLLVLTGANTVPEALGTIQGWKANSDRLPAVEAALAEAQATAATEEVTRMVATGMADGRIPPAMQTYWEGQPVEAVRQYLTAAMPAAPVDKSKQPAAPGGAENPAGGTAHVVLTGAAADVARAFGNDPKKVAAHAAKGQVS